MNYRYFVLLITLLFLISCSKDNEDAIVIADKKLNSITHVFYNYVYPDQPPTRTFTSNYSLNDAKINTVNTSLFHYFHDDQSRNFTDYLTSSFSYDSNNRLVKVEYESYSDFESTEKYFRTYEFNYHENNKIKSMSMKDGSGILISKNSFDYAGDMIQEKYEYFDNGALIFYNESTYEIDGMQRIYRQTSKGPFFVDNDDIVSSETSQEASFDADGNVDRTLFNGRPYEEYNYSDIKIPSDLPEVNLPFLGYIPYNIMLAQFDRIVQSYNSNYISTITQLEPSNQFTIIYKNTLSKDNYPLKIDVFFDDKISSETTYTYE